MATTTHGASGAADLGNRDRTQQSTGRTADRLSTETKASFKTTEFFAYLVTFIAILIAGNAIEGQEGGADYFAGDKVWLYITLLTIGYMVSRGLAKSGSRDPYWGERGDRNADH
jgi:uncharacterized MAPEG superfamily protein